MVTATTSKTTEKLALDMTNITTVEAITEYGDLKVIVEECEPYVEIALSGSTSYEFVRRSQKIGIYSQVKNSVFGRSENGCSFTLHIPAGMKLNLITSQGEIEVEGSIKALKAIKSKGMIIVKRSGEANMELITSEGDIAMMDVAGDIRIIASEGNISVDGAQGTLQILGNKGAIEAFNIEGRAQFTNTKGNITVKGLQLQPGALSWITSNDVISIEGLSAPYGVNLHCEGNKDLYELNLPEYTIENKWRKIEARQRGSHEAMLVIRTGSKARISSRE